MTTPASFHAEMEAAAAAGLPLLDNVADSCDPDGPGACTCPVLPHDHLENECGAAMWARLRAPQQKDTP